MVASLRPTYRHLQGKGIDRTSQPGADRNLRRKAKDIWIAVTPGTAGLSEHSAYRLVIRRN